MSPLLIRRREFAKGLAFGLAMAASLPVIAQAAPIATQAPATRPPRPRDLLPPSRRPVDVFCRDCGTFLGTLTVDESERAAEIACGRCYRDLEREKEDLEVPEDDFDREDLQSERDDLENDLEGSRADVKRLLHAHDDLLQQLWAIADQLPRDSRIHERVRDAIDLVHDVGAKVTVP